MPPIRYSLASSPPSLIDDKVNKRRRSIRRRRPHQSQKQKNRQHDFPSKKITIPFEDFCSVMVCGASNSGKTTFVFECIKNFQRMFKTTPPVSTHYFYGIHQDLFDKPEFTHKFNVYFHKGAPTESDINKISSDGKCHAIILDDLMEEVANNAHLCRLFTQGCHHKRLCVFFITQNMFQKAKFTQTISKNVQYFVFTKSPRNLCSLLNLCKQVFRGKGHAVEEAYKDVVRNNKQPIFVLDLHPSSDERFHMRTNIFETATIAYVPKIKIP